MTSFLASRWTLLDRVIQIWRFKKVVDLIQPDARVVDVGCGDGSFLKSISHRIQAGYGVDLKDQPAFANIVFLAAKPGHRLALASGSVDVVTALALFEHLDDPEGFVAETLRVLKPQGCLILTTPAPVAKPLLEFRAFRLGIISENDIRDHKRYFAPHDLAALLSGYSSIRIEPFQYGLNTLVHAVK
jgi:2-polyprenyl-3-methyl-5-hydroxy-6-metoxy-1,4-benzoquinol methylase